MNTKNKYTQKSKIEFIFVRKRCRSIYNHNLITKIYKKNHLRPGSTPIAPQLISESNCVRSEWTQKYDKKLALFRLYCDELTKQQRKPQKLEFLTKL